MGKAVTFLTSKCGEGAMARFSSFSLFFSPSRHLPTFSLGQSLYLIWCSLSSYFLPCEVLRYIIYIEYHKSVTLTYRVGKYSTRYLLLWLTGYFCSYFDIIEKVHSFTRLFWLLCEAVYPNLSSSSNTGIFFICIFLTLLLYLPCLRPHQRP